MSVVINSLSYQETTQRAWGECFPSGSPNYQHVQVFLISHCVFTQINIIFGLFIIIIPAQEKSEEGESGHSVHLTAK